MTDLQEISINAAAALAIIVPVVWGLIKIVMRSHKDKLNELSVKADRAATRDEVLRLHSRVDVLESRAHEQVRDLRSDMNGMGQRLEAAFSARLDTIQGMLRDLTATLLNGKGKD